MNKMTLSLCPLFLKTSLKTIHSFWNYFAKGEKKTKRSTVSRTRPSPQDKREPAAEPEII